MALSREDKDRLCEAEGFLDLGMLQEAASELAQLNPAAEDDPEVLTLRVALFRRTEEWEPMEAAARQLAQLWPHKPDCWIVWSFAKRRTDSLEAGLEILLRGERKHPQSAVIQFSLGCYACLMGNPGEAARRIQRAIELDERFREIVLEDPELAALWEVE
jgi:tetratricopeptide (TPR) repeat protein